MWVVLATKGVVGTHYEPLASDMTFEMGPGMEVTSPLGRWFLSAVTQMGLFFDYARYWLIPDVRTMSIDMRVDFAGNWTSLLIALRLTTFLACPVGALWLLKKGGHYALFGAGLLYSWLLFLTELATIRFQEPFVLYRSYLWAPGLLLMAIALLTLLPRKVVAVFAAIALPLLYFQANDRLSSFTDELHVWQDAVAALPDERIPGAGRSYYNRGRVLLQMKRYADSIADMDKSIAMYPKVAQVYGYKGLAALGLKDYALAMANFDKALELKPEFADVHFARGLVLEQWGRHDEALAAYTKSLALGNMIAKLKIEALNNR